MEHEKATPGSTIFRQGDPGDKFYIIQSGKVRVYRKDRGGLETQLSALGPGESFGEMALLTGEARSASVEALEETHLMALSKDQFERILKDSPDISLAFVHKMSEWLLKADATIEKEARQQHLADQASWFHFVLILGVSIILACFQPVEPERDTLVRGNPSKRRHSLRHTRLCDGRDKEGRYGHGGRGA